MAIDAGGSRRDLAPPADAHSGGQDAAPRVGAVRSVGAGEKQRGREHEEARRGELRGGDGAGDGLAEVEHGRDPGAGGADRLTHGDKLTSWCPCPGRLQPRWGLSITK